MNSIFLELLASDQEDYTEEGDQYSIQRAEQLRDDFGAELSRLKRDQEALNETHSKIALISVLDKRQVEVDDKAQKALGLTDSLVSMGYLMSLFISNSEKLTSQLSKGSSIETRDQIKLLSRIAAGPVYQGANYTSAEFFKEYEAKTNSFKVSFRVLLTGTIAAVLLWNLAVSGTLYFLKQTSQKVVVLFEEHLRLGTEHTKQLMEESTLGSTSDAQIPSYSKEFNDLASQSKDTGGSLLDSRGKQHSELSIRVVIRLTILVLVVYVSLAIWAFHQEEKFLAQNKNVHGHIHLLQNRALTLHYMNNMAMSNSITADSGISMTAAAAGDISKSDSILDKTALSLASEDAFKSYMQILYAYNNGDVCELLSKDISLSDASHVCSKATKEMLVQGLSSGIKKLEGMIASTKQLKLSDFVLREQALLAVHQAGEKLQSRIVRDFFEYLDGDCVWDYIKMMAIVCLTFVAVVCWFKVFDVATYDIWATKERLSKVSIYEIKDNDFLFAIIRQKDFLEELE